MVAAGSFSVWPLAGIGTGVPFVVGGQSVVREYVSVKASIALVRSNPHGASPR